MKPGRFFRFDISTAALIIANIVTIVFAVIQKWDVANVMWIYLAQSFVITCFTSLRITTLKQFSVGGNWNGSGKTVEGTRRDKINTAISVPIIMGLWNAAYVIFLYYVLGKPNLESGAATGFLVCILVFLANHTFSYFYNLPRDRRGKPNVNRIFSAVFIRIIPMHLTMVIAAVILEQESMRSSTTILILFLVSKTIIDIMTHNSEHSIGQDEEQSGSL